MARRVKKVGVSAIVSGARRFQRAVRYGERLRRSFGMRFLWHEMSGDERRQQLMSDGRAETADKLRQSVLCSSPNKLG